MNARSVRRLLLLTGAPGVGKTTVARRVAGTLAGRLRIAGFTTDEIREQGQRLGFRLVPFGEAPRVMAHTTFSTMPRVGRYGVDVAAIDEVVARKSRNANTCRLLRGFARTSRTA